MERVVLVLDENTYERARRLAEARESTLERLFEEALDELELKNGNDGMFGLFADKPEVVDEMLEYVMDSRANALVRSEDE